MEIVVCVKQVPDSQRVGMDMRTGTLNRGESGFMLNPADASAMEAARALKDVAGGSIRVLCMGPANAEAALRQAARQGADRLLLAADPAFAGADAFATATVLRAAIESTGPFDLVLCGRRAIDGETGQVGGELAALLGLPCLANALALRPEGRGVLARRMDGRGQEEIYSPLPVVATVCESYRERPPTLADMRKSIRLGIERLDRNALGFGDGEPRTGLRGSKTRVRRIFAPAKTHRGGTMFRDLDSIVLAAITKLGEIDAHDT